MIRMFRLILGLLIFTSTHIYAQIEADVLPLRGVVKKMDPVDATKPSIKLPGADVTIYQDGVLFKQVKTDNNGKIDEPLPLNHLYQIEFGHEGCVSKFLTVDAHVGSAEKDQLQYAFKLEVELFDYIEDIDYSILQNPIGVIMYIPEKSAFNYDRKYTYKVKTSLARLHSQVAAKHLKRKLKEQGMSPEEIASRKAESQRRYAEYLAQKKAAAEYAEQLAATEAKKNQELAEINKANNETQKTNSDNPETTEALTPEKVKEMTKHIESSVQTADKNYALKRQNITEHNTRKLNTITALSEIEKEKNTILKKLGTLEAVDVDFVEDKRDWIDEMKSILPADIGDINDLIRELTATRKKYEDALDIYLSSEEVRKSLGDEFNPVKKIAEIDLILADLADYQSQVVSAQMDLNVVSYELSKHEFEKTIASEDYNFDNDDFEEATDQFSSSINEFKDRTDELTATLTQLESLSAQIETTQKKLEGYPQKEESQKVFDKLSSFIQNLGKRKEKLAAQKRDAELQKQRADKGEELVAKLDKMEEKDENALIVDSDEEDLQAITTTKRTEKEEKFRIEMESKQVLKRRELLFEARDVSLQKAIEQEKSEIQTMTSLMEKASRKRIFLEHVAESTRSMKMKQAQFQN